MKFIETNNIKGDLFGGITAGIVALPLALAFGIQAFGGVSDPSAASMGALAGIVGATMLGFFAALFGGTHSQISGPTGPMTVVTATLIGGIWASSGGSISDVLISMSLAGIFCGLFQILFGIVKLGKYIRYIPYPVLSGFMSGIGVIIILQQLYPLVGLKGSGTMIDLLFGIPDAVAQGISVKALLLGLGTILIIELFPLVTKKVPATLVALIVMTVVSLFCNLDSRLIIGEIPSGMPLPVFAKSGIDFAAINWIAVLKASVIPGLTLAGLGSIDTLLTSVVADNITKTKHNSNKELIGQGIGNAIAGLFCGLPGAGATMRTVVNVKRCTAPSGRAPRPGQPGQIRAPFSSCRHPHHSGLGHHRLQGFQRPAENSQGRCSRACGCLPHHRLCGPAHCCGHWHGHRLCALHEARQ